MAWHPCCCATCDDYAATLNWMLTTSGGSCTCGWNGQTGTVTRTGSAGNYTYTHDVTGCVFYNGGAPASTADYENPFDLRCVAGGLVLNFPGAGFTMAGVPFGTSCTGDAIAALPTMVSATPGAVEFYFTGTIQGTCACSGQTWTLTFWE